MRPGLRANGYRLARTLPRRIGGYLALVVLVGLVGGLSLAAIAGARRTASSFPTYVNSTNPSTLNEFAGFDNPSLGSDSGYNPDMLRTLTHLHHVVSAAVSVGFDGNIDLTSVAGVHAHYTAGETPPTVVGGLDGEYQTQDRLTVVQGRLAFPQRTDEAVMDAQAAKEWRLHLGSVITMPFYSDAEDNSASYNGPYYRRVTVRIVGEVVLANTVVQDDINALGSGVVVLTPALTRQLASCCSYYSGAGLVIEGGPGVVAHVSDEADRLDPLAAAGIGQGGSVGLAEAKAQRAIKPEAIALGVFGTIAGLAVLLIAAQVIGRLLAQGADDAFTLRALGADRSTLLGDGLLGVAMAVVLGSVLAAGVAVTLSPLTPLGPVRPVYPTPGVAFDWTVLGLGFVALVLALSAIALVTADRQVRRLPGSGGHDAAPLQPGIVRSAARASLPISLVTGLRFALETGRGRSAVPVRSAILGAVLAVLVMVTTVTFSASLDTLVSHPALYGWNWDAALLSGFAGQEDLPAAQTASLLGHDPDVAAWSGVNFVGVKLDGQPVQALAERTGAPVGPPLLSGHGLEGPDQVVVGGTTLSALHKRVGDSVALTVHGAPPRQLRIVGTATMASITKGLEMGTGALLPVSSIPAPLLNTQESYIPGPNAILVRLRHGVTLATAERGFDAIGRSINGISGDGAPAGGVVPVLHPAEIVNYRSMGTTPAILGLGLATGAVVGLGLTLVTSVRRRRRDLALLKTLGFTRHQLASAVVWQSGISVAIGTAVGVPLGIVLGRYLWILFAHGIDAVPAPTVPAFTVTLLAVGGLALSLVVAAVPARLAARTPTAMLLRAE